MSRRFEEHRGVRGRERRGRERGKVKERGSVKGRGRGRENYTE